MSDCYTNLGLLVGGANDMGGSKGLTYSWYGKSAPVPLRSSSGADGAASDTGNLQRRVLGLIVLSSTADDNLQYETIANLI